MRLTLGKCAVLIGLLLPCSLKAQEIDALIQSLANPSASARLEAQARLEQLGQPARQALMVASRSDEPAVASAAVNILLTRFPWDHPEDPSEVGLLLKEYGNKDDAERIRITSLLMQRGEIAVPALLRLVLEDPSEDVCWKIVSQFCNRRTNNPRANQITRLNRAPKVIEQLRRLDPPANRPAALVLAGLAWQWIDYAKGMDFFRRAVEAEVLHPTFDDNELDYAFDELTEAAEANKDYELAIRYRRIQASRIGLTGSNYPQPIYLLFMLHGKYGPLPGFENDLQKYSEHLGDTPVLYSLSRAYARNGQTLEAMACEQAAAVATMDSLDNFMNVEVLRLSGHWIDFARRLAYGAQNDTDITNALYVYNSRASLAEMAAEEENDVAASDHFSVLDGSAAMHYVLAYSARIASKKNDKATLTDCLNRLLRLSPTNSEVIHIAYPLFIAADRRADALTLFSRAYEAQLEDIAANPENPMERNNMAWLCARCDQKLDEALELATNAVALTPYGAGNIDTLAEVQFRRGNAAEAVKLETRAVEIEPENVFMLRQLARFKAGLKQ